MPYRDFRLYVSSCRDFADDPDTECESEDEIKSKLDSFFVNYIIISENFELNSDLGDY